MHSYLPALSCVCYAKVEFGLPDLAGRAQIFKIHAKSMNCDRGIRFELLARLCPNTTGAELRSVCTEVCMCYPIHYLFGLSLFVMLASGHN